MGHTGTGRGRYVVLRLAYAALTLLVAVTVVFFCFRAVPGDPARLLLPVGSTDPATLEAQRHALRLDTPLWSQYVSFAGDALLGRFGMSFNAKVEVGRLLRSAVGRSLLVLGAGVAVCAALVAFLWLVLTARLPDWLTTTAGVVYGCLGAAVVAWTYLAAHDDLPDGMGRYRYYTLIPHSRSALGDGWQDVVRAGLLVGLIVGGLLGCAFWLAWRRRRGERQAVRETGLAVPPLTWRRVAARCVGRSWGVHLVCAALVVYVVVIAEQAALLRESAGALFALSTQAHDYPVLAASWLTAALLVVCGALALSLAVVVLDPTAVGKGRRSHPTSRSSAHALASRS